MKKTIIILGAVMFLLPLLLIGYVSYLEMQKYQPEEAYKIVEKAYGTPMQVVRQSVSECFTLSGTFTSKTHVFIDADNKDGKTVRALVSVGDEVKKDDPLAVIGEKPLVSTVNGVVEEVSLFGEKGYVKLLDLGDLVYECALGDTMSLSVGDSFTTESGETVTLSSLSNMESDGSRKAYFTVTGGNYLYGKAKTFTVYTGTVFQNVLVVDKDCVYRKEAGGPYYVRRVDASGVVIGEVEVQVGISDGKYITVTGLEEGWYCDSGYAQFVNLQKT